MQARHVICVITSPVLVLLFSAIGPAHSQTLVPQSSFVRTDFATGLEPSSIAAADFDGDGKPDLAVASLSSSLVSILPGNGDGTFRERLEVSSSGFPLSIVTGDFDKNGVTDMLVAGWSGVSVLLGNRGGRFGAPTYLFNEAAVSLATGDFNSDGKEDAVWGTWDTAYISFGKGDGTFQSYASLQTGQWHPCVISADLNKDGKLDLALTFSDGTFGGVSILLGAGDGTFVKKAEFASGGDAMGSAAAGDLNRDSILDLVVVNEAGTLSVLRGNGDGTFASEVDYLVSSDAVAVSLADFDGDSALDAAVAAPGSSLSLLMGKGDCSFQPKVDLAVGVADHNGILAADLNGDSKPDLVVLNSPPMDSVSVFTNTLGGSEPPVALCRDVTVQAGPACAASAVIDAGSFASDSTAQLMITQNPPGPYPLGQTNVTLTVTDVHGSSQCSAAVTVVDLTPPSVRIWSATPQVLWPVNGKMTPVSFAAGASDRCGGPVTCGIARITSNEPVSPGGDWAITGELTANLRAARLGTGAGRAYTITLQCADAAGNKTAKDVVVVVPHDDRK